MALISIPYGTIKTIREIMAIAAKDPFQFHTVRLKLDLNFLPPPPENYFNSIRYD